ncbi:MAG: hypothetical protein IJH84_10015 [Saccharopolyspora sp.]|uniref:hypothetical protein n=1 Tax=Saccharopolyspora sp. TaxID=33915 RepID=UPI0025F4B3F4|nr:hypothetical protein [Saccharopolyspora sp.]MBQ6641356.1 hypothetical protein [Saccharopolyspora sp.]
MTRTSKNRDFEQQRQQVRQVAGELAGESTSVVHVGARSVVCHVPGRRADGTPRGTENVRWAARKVFLTLTLLGRLIFWMIANILLDDSHDLPDHSKNKLTVRGEESCAALSFADAVREAAGDAWLAWSHSQVALLKADDEQGPRVLWRVTGDQRPKLQVVKGNLRWPDDSSVEFTLSAAERTRVTERQGTP